MNNISRMQILQDLAEALVNISAAILETPVEDDFDEFDGEEDYEAGFSDGFDAGQKAKEKVQPSIFDSIDLGSFATTECACGCGQEKPYKGSDKF